MSKKAERSRAPKSLYLIRAPSYFGNKEIGTTLCDDPAKLIGRTVKVSLYNLTDDFSKQYMIIRFKIIRVDGSEAHTVFYGHEYGREFLRSLVRRGTSRIDGYYNLKTLDNVAMRVQGTVFTVKRETSGKKRIIRRIMKEVLEASSSKLTLDQFAQELVLGKTASDIYNSVKKILLPRHVGIVKSKVLSLPQDVLKEMPKTEIAETTENSG
ncbi:MAG: 30S ribosomal protein S3ae [Nitrososphaerota archaeon]